MHYNNVSCILDVCDWLLLLSANRFGLGFTHDVFNFSCHMFMHFSCIRTLLFSELMSTFCSSSFSFVYHHGCHMRWFRLAKWGPASTKTATSGDDQSYSFCYSTIFLGSFYLYNWWCHPRGHHCATSADGGWLWWSSWLSHKWDVLDEHPSRSYYLQIGSYGWLCSFTLSRASHGLSFYGWWGWC